MAFCILKDKINDFKRALKDKELNIIELMKMDSAKRTEVFKEFAGNDAGKMNLLFEEKLILKNRIQGIKNWASKVGEVGRYDPANKAKLDALLSEYKSRQQERMLDPKENEGFLSDLVEEKMGVRISKEQAKVAWDMQLKSDKAFENYDPKTETWKSKNDAIEYGATKQVYKKYIDNLKNERLPVKGMLEGYKREIKELWKEDQAAAIKKISLDSISTLSKTMINAVASWDNSFMGRQGAMTLIKSPKTWWNMAGESMKDFYAGMKGNADARQDALFGTVYSHPDYINGKFKKAGIEFGIEEEVPIQLMERVPVAGKLFKASDIAFTDSAIRARLGLWDIMKQVDKAKKYELDEAGLRDRGKIINSITARGKIGRIGGSEPVKLLMWAPRMLKADWDVLTGHTFGLGLETKQARIEAASNITKLVITTAGITAMAQAMGADVETDPRSTDFLKIKIGNTRINTPFLRGIPQLVTLLSRAATRETKSSAGIISKLNSGEYGSKTVFDVGLDFLTNKTTPPAKVVIDYLKGRNFAGEKQTPGSIAFSSLPISVQNFIGLKDDSSSAAIFGAFGDLFGINSNTYSQEADWGQNTGKELSQFKLKVGDTAFQEANDLYNKQYNDWLIMIKKDPEYQSLSSEEKQKVQVTKKSKIKENIFKQYKFKYEQDKTKANPLIKKLSK